MEAKLTRTKVQQGRNSCSIRFDNLTRGEALALMNALALRSTESSVCLDVFNVARTAVREWPELDSDVTGPVK